ncbi:transposase [Nocardia seriolae]|uniref:Transposase n=1 Tax=Nocardia seriolae TaxID=37332 RepID=A0ABC9Z773_9NOCA|nr:transposase [Nocardia seriolae]BAW09588.1 transposase [Nocardia seriolae]BEK98645.1 IS701 family transposase [Nocardia seriolae]GAP33508.1 transposase [Nocardia seriolae]
MLVDEDLAAWTAGLEELFARVAGRFHRAEPRLRARAYVRGLLAPLAGKNGWTLAEAAGDLSPNGMQRLLNKAAWDVDGVRDEARAYAVEHLGDPGGVLVVDETGFLKKVLKSAGVQRQYSGTAGRVENCQLGVFCAYATVKGRTLIDRELYLPKSWTADRDRCREAGVPDEVEFATKQVLAQRMLARALDAGVPARWVTAGEAYGGDSKFRRWLERRRIGYVVAVPTSAPIVSLSGSWRADQVVADAPAEAWKRLSCGEGAQGPRLFDWAVATLPSLSEAGAGWRRWLLARRSLTRNAKGEHEIAYYLCGAPIGTSDEELIQVAGARWSVEDCFQTAKTEVGLDQYQVRRYDAWYRHITLALLAHTYLAVTAAVYPKALAAASFHSRSVKSSVSWHT